VWCFTRVFLRTPSGRQRLNVLGALNAVTRQLVCLTNQTFVNADTVCELLDKLRSLHGLGRSITLVLDNARYQHCQKVIAFAKKRKIDLLFLPGYSPNLNLIERLWKFIKKNCLNGKYYSTSQQFMAAIESSLEGVNNRHQQALKSLLTLKFQTFNNVQLLRA
jgi:transposase